MSRIVVAAFLILFAAKAAYAGNATVINDGASFLEGPVVVDGKLLYAEYGAHRVTQWDGKTNTTLWSQDGCGPSAIVPMGSNFAITCYDSGQLVVISADGTTKASFDADAAGGAHVEAARARLERRGTTGAEGARVRARGNERGHQRGEQQCAAARRVRERRRAGARVPAFGGVVVVGGRVGKERDHVCACARAGRRARDERELLHATQQLPHNTVRGPSTSSRAPPGTSSQTWRTGL